MLWFTMILYTFDTKCNELQWFCIHWIPNALIYNDFAYIGYRMLWFTMILHTFDTKCYELQWFCMYWIPNAVIYNDFAYIGYQMLWFTLILHTLDVECYDLQWFYINICSKHVFSLSYLSFLIHTCSKPVFSLSYLSFLGFWQPGKIRVRKSSKSEVQSANRVPTSSIYGFDCCWVAKNPKKTKN